MVRVNIIDVKKLTDQHLVAEFDEIFMLVSYFKRYPALVNIPVKFCLGTGHMKFFKDKILYIQKRHELIRREMLRRGFNPVARIDYKGLPRLLFNNWKPSKDDRDLIKSRLLERIKAKPSYYRHFGEVKSYSFWKEKIKIS